MNNPTFAGPDPVRSRLRAAMATLEREVAGASPPKALVEALAEVVSQLALGPEPEVRKCPECGYVGMRAATTCSNCWTKLTPPATSAD